MQQFFTKTPTSVLSCLSIVPIVFILLPPDIWAYINILAFSFLALWLYSITKMLSNKNKFDKGLKFGNFALILFSVMLYVIFLSIYFARTFNQLDDPGWFLLVILIGHSFLLFSIFYLTNFVAKSISTLDKKMIVVFNDYAQYFFLLLFFPVGIWWLHSKIKSVANR